MPVLGLPVLGPLAGGPSGPSSPAQTGRGAKGQHVYGIVMVQPTPAVLLGHGFKKPEQYTREEFKVLQGE